MLSITDPLVMRDERFPQYKHEFIFYNHSGDRLAARHYSAWDLVVEIASSVVDHVIGFADTRVVEGWVKIPSWLKPIFVKIDPGFTHNS
jgi:hypothetical protein